jgi:hypothetical protein
MVRKTCSRCGVGHFLQIAMLPGKRALVQLRVFPADGSTSVSSAFLASVLSLVETTIAEIESDGYTVDRGVFDLPPTRPAQAPPESRSGCGIVALLLIGVIVVFFAGAGLISNAFRKDPPPPSANDLMVAPLFDRLTAGSHLPEWPEDGYCRFQPDGYHLGPSVDLNRSTTCRNEKIIVSNSDVTVRAKLLRRDNAQARSRASFDSGFGLFVWGGTSTGFSVRTDGVWAYYDMSWTEGGSAKAIRRKIGSLNELRLRVNGKRFTFYVNGKKVATRKVPGFTQGRLTLHADTFDEVVFSRLTMRTL